MSWDADLMDGDEMLKSWNYTHNTNGMISAALEAVGIGFQGSWYLMLNGLSAAGGAAMLHAIVAELVAHPEKYEPMNPENGWGSYDRVIDVLTSMRNAALNAPATAKWSVSG